MKKPLRKRSGFVDFSRDQKNLLFALPVLTGRDVGQLFENAGKITLIVKTDRVGNICNGHGAVA